MAEQSVAKQETREQAWEDLERLEREQQEVQRKKAEALKRVVEHEHREKWKGEFQTGVLSFDNDSSLVVELENSTKFVKGFLRESATAKYHTSDGRMYLLGPDYKILGKSRKRDRDELETSLPLFHEVRKKAEYDSSFQRRKIEEVVERELSKRVRGR